MGSLIVQLYRLTAIISAILIVSSHPHPLCGAEEVQTSEEEEEVTFPYKTVRTEEGLLFRVPEDMPIEKRGGIIAPIPFDEYVYGKIEGLKRKISSTEERLARIEEKLGMIEVSKKPKEKSDKTLSA